MGVDGGAGTAPRAREPTLAVRALEKIMGPLDKLRPKTLAHARGRVLEVGVGTGLNFRFYPPDIEHLTGIEPDPVKLEHARARAAVLPCPVTLVAASAEALPFPDASFDTAVITWALCTIPEVERALREVRRVLRPGGMLTYIEHTRSPHAPMRLLQRLVDPAWQRVSGGCHLTREPRALVSAAGFVHEHWVEVNARPWNPFPVFAGLARAP